MRDYSEESQDMRDKAEKRADDLRESAEQAAIRQLSDIDAVTDAIDVLATQINLVDLSGEFALAVARRSFMAEPKGMLEEMLFNILVELEERK